MKLSILVFLGASLALAGASILKQSHPFQEQEGSCKGKCDTPLDPNAPCQCNTSCDRFGDCCLDYEEECESTGEPITNAELEALGEEFFTLEGPNNCGDQVLWDLQGETTSGSTNDKAPLPLLTINSACYLKPTVSLIRALFDNYEASVSTPEVVTPAEVAEENAFIDAVLATPIWQRLLAFLQSKGVSFSREKFHQMWFGLYSRSGSTLGSSGFEHVFLGELKSGVSGFHNYLFFGREEDNDDLNYRGWMKFSQFGTKGGLIQHNFQWQGQNKPISSMFIGTSPEFEMAVYTVCWLTRPDSTNCPMSFSGVKAKVTTYTIGSSKQFVASSYADPS